MLSRNHVEGVPVKCAGGILIKDNKILLGKRSGNRTFYPDVWDIRWPLER